MGGKITSETNVQYKCDISPEKLLQVKFYKNMFVLNTNGGEARSRLTRVGIKKKGVG